jgi:staphylococcal nuclease domain-containing protein 1
VVEEGDRKTNFKKVVVTEVISGVTFWAQHLDNATQFEQMQQQMRTDLLDNPPLPGSLTPKRNDLVASLFLDNLWYRARIEKIESGDKVHVLYVDYGNREVVPSTKLAALPGQYASFAPQAKEYTLALVKAVSDEEVLYDLTNAFGQEAVNHEFSLNIEYKVEKQEFVSLTNPETKADLASKLIADGWAMVDKRREKRLQSMIADYTKAQETARKNRLNLWRYGDFTEDDAPEFGS